jgi:hypothetical protein
VSAHTPGPWTVGRGADGLPIVHTPPDTFSPSGQGVAHICKRTMCQDHDANARLIAAAPELLAALKDTLSSLEACVKRREPDWNWYATPESVIGKARLVRDAAQGIVTQRDETRSGSVEHSEIEPGPKDAPETSGGMGADGIGGGESVAPVVSSPTPGPWTLGIWERHIWVGGGPNNDDIAEFNFDEEHAVKITREEAIANARLFLGAPGLLTVLEEFIHDGRLQTFEDRERFRKAARAAIAKATSQ